MMTTLTVYFASSTASPPSAPSSSSSSATTSSNATTIAATAAAAAATVQPTRLVPVSLKSVPLSSDLPSISLPTPTSSNPTPFASRTSSKRNKTFFERFDQTSPSTMASNSQSPSYQQHQTSIDSSNDSAPRLRRRFTFRRSLRHSVHNKGGDVDDGIRSVALICYSYFFGFFLTHLFFSPSAFV